MNTFNLVCCYILSLLILEKVLYAYSNPKLDFSSKYYTKTNALECIGNPDFVANISCKLKAINWEHTVANMDVDLLGSVQNASVRFEVFKYTNQFRPFLVNVTINVCDLMKRLHTNIYAKVAMDIIRKYSNVNHTCPYSGHLAARGIYVDTRYIPFNMPTGKYKFAFSFYEGWPLVHIGTIAMTVSLEERNNMKRTANKSSDRDRIAKDSG